jgi:hypothetical protein
VAHDALEREVLHETFAALGALEPQYGYRHCDRRTCLSSGWFFLANLPHGDIVWKLISSCTAIIAVVKPFLRFGEKIKKIEQALIAYRGLDFDLAQLAGEVRKTQQYSSAQQKQFKSATSKRKELVVRLPSIDEDKELRDALYWEVTQELPDTEFSKRRAERFF